MRNLFDLLNAQNNTFNVCEKLERAKAELHASDSKVIECMECSLVGKEAPYDIKALHEERQNLREEIRDLESQLNNSKAN